VVQPEETQELVAPNMPSSLYRLKNDVLKTLAKPYIAWKLRPSGVEAAISQGAA